MEQVKQKINCGELSVESWRYNTKSFTFTLKFLNEKNKTLQDVKKSTLLGETI